MLLFYLRLFCNQARFPVTSSPAQFSNTLQFHQCYILNTKEANTVSIYANRSGRTSNANTSIVVIQSGKFHPFFFLGNMATLSVSCCSTGTCSIPKETIVSHFSKKLQVENELDNTAQDFWNFVLNNDVESIRRFEQQFSSVRHLSISWSSLRCLCALKSLQNLFLTPRNSEPGFNTIWNLHLSLFASMTDKLFQF